MIDQYNRQQLNKNSINKCLCVPNESPKKTRHIPSHMYTIITQHVIT